MKTFQELIEDLFKGLNFVHTNADEYLVAGPDMEYHHERLYFEKWPFCKHSKSQIVTHSLDVLGELLTQGILPLKSKVAAVLDYTKLATDK